MQAATAVVFGAGKMGCGLLGRLLHLSDYDTVFVARRAEVVNAINRHSGYWLTVAGPTVRRVRVRRCRALLLADRPAVTLAVARADLVLTGLGVDNLAAIAPLVAEGLWRRSQGLAARPLNVVACENLPGAGAYLRHQIVSAASLDRGLAVERCGGFGAALTRRIMTGGEIRDGELWFAVSGSPELVVDTKGLKGVFPRLHGVTFTESFDALVKRKLFTLNLAQAAAAYLGYRCGCRYVHDAAVHPAVAPTVRSAVEEARAALQAEFPDQRAEIARDAARAIAEIAAPSLADTVRRVARDPRRKLSSVERLVGPARLAARHGLPHDDLSLVIAAALTYDHPDDAAARDIQRAIATEGIEKMLAIDCGLLPYEPLARAVKERWHELKTRDLEPTSLSGDR
jgi:mannitol-1-phosphate 5-dehydrogenase